MYVLNLRCPNRHHPASPAVIFSVVFPFHKVHYNPAFFAFYYKNTLCPLSEQKKLDLQCLNHYMNNHYNHFSVLLSQRSVCSSSQIAICNIAFPPVVHFLMSDITKKWHQKQRSFNPLILMPSLANIIFQIIYR